MRILVIELQEVSKIFSGPKGEEVVAVDRVSFQVETGKTVCLLGTSGSGKTTAMKMINRLIEPTQGKILLDGVDILDQDVIQLRRKIGYVIQQGGLFPHMTAAQNIGLLCRLEKWPKAKTKARVEELMQLVNLPPREYAERYPAEMSGGQQQRVGVARALALDPPTILMDEPFGALDPITRDQIHEEFLQLQARVGKTIILVTHDLSEASKLGDQIALLDGGRLIQFGTEQELKDNPANEFVSAFFRSHQEVRGAA